MEGGQEGVNADALSSKTVQIDGLWCCDVSKVAAHEFHIGYGYVVVRMRTRQEVGAQAPVMARHVACLRGWHPALARAELASLLPDLETERLEGRRLMCLDGDVTEGVLSQAVAVSSGCQAILCNALVWAHQGPESMDAFIAAVIEHVQAHPQNGTVAVRAWRHEGRIEGVGPSQLAQRIGGRLSDAGYAIDLDAPDHRFGVVIDASSNTIACGWMVGFGDESDGIATRRAAERPFFKPVSLDPRLARLAVNIASGPVHTGTTLDMMTGTGGFLIEAALSGRTVVGLDLDEVMVQGTQENLAWALKGHSDHMATVCQGDSTNLSTALPQGCGPVSGFVLDPPYGRNSQGSLAPMKLLESGLISAQEVAHSNAGLVLILPIHPMGEHPDAPLHDEEVVDLLHGEWSEVEQALSLSGWSIQGRWIEHVHASLGRLILHATVVPQD